MPDICNKCGTSMEGGERSCPECGSRNVSFQSHVGAKTAVGAGGTWSGCQVIETAIGAVIALAILGAMCSGGLPAYGSGLLALEVVLGLLVFIAIVLEVRSWWRGIRLNVKREDKSMNILYAMYVTATLICSLAVEVADVAEGFEGQPSPKLPLPQCGVNSTLFMRSQPSQ